MDEIIELIDMRNFHNMSFKTFWKIAKNKDIVLTDFFDTLIFRRIHSFQIDRQWAKALIHRLGLKADVDIIVKARRNAIAELRKDFDEPPYQKVMEKVYRSFHQQLKISECEFCKVSLETDVDVELGCQYGNNHLISLLRRAKNNGKRIYIVSDFYLPADVYKDFLLNAGCEDIIDGIFVSETCGKTKAKGDIFKYVTEVLGVEARQCMMIGDSRQSDVEMAERNSIKGIWYFPLMHKVWTNISRRLNLNYGKRIQDSLSSYLYRTSLFDEYAIVLYHFAHQLVATATKDGTHKLAFISRGGYFLKQVVDVYLRHNPGKEIETTYCYASRKTCLTNDTEQQECLMDYLSGFKDGDTLVMVDEGWYCHSQQRISERYKLHTIGYYLGVRGKDAEVEGCVRKGILFDKYGNEGKPTRYYGIFNTNCSMYEQMLTSNEGSVTGYQRDTEGRIIPLLHVNYKEHALYSEVIGRWQTRMKLVVKGLCAWKLGEDVDEKKLAKMVLRTSLFASRERCKFLNKLDRDMIDNFNQTKQIAKTAKDAHVRILELIKHPDMYLGMVCKVQRMIYRNKPYNLAYKTVAVCYYFYVRTLKGLW